MENVRNVIEESGLIKNTVYGGIGLIIIHQTRLTITHTHNIHSNKNTENKSFTYRK